MRKTKEKLAIFAIFSALLGIALFLDEPLAKKMALVQVPVLDSFFLVITSLVTIAFVLLIMSAGFLWKKQPRIAIVLVVTAVIGLVSGFFLKYLFLRPRPEMSLGLIPLATEHSPSFPSAHASLVSAEVPLLARAASLFLLLWIPFAILVVASRLYLGVHYLSDIIGGIFVGLVIGELLHTWSAKYWSVKHV